MTDAETNLLDCSSSVAILKQQIKKKERSKRMHERKKHSSNEQKEREKLQGETEK